jgi:hypothetical protein
MNNEGIWNDESRDQLGKTFQRVILGELRLAKRGHEEILEACREAYIPDDCPDRERDTFIQFATDELNRTATGLTSEMAMWPEETDCDRLDRVEVASFATESVATHFSSIKICLNSWPKALVCRSI